MLPAYRTRFETLAAVTDDLLAAVAALPDPNAQPTDGGWSGTQVVRHLIGAEASITTLLEKQVAKPAAELPAAGLKNWFRSKFMSYVLAKPGRKFKMPARLPEPGAEVAAVEELRREWATKRQNLGRLLVNFPLTHQQRAVFQHPRAGWLTMPQTLQFLTDHVRHHLQQVERLRG
jgi:hypothetical protein